VSKAVEIKTKFDALYIDPIALKKIQYWTDAADGEVSGLGILEQEDGKMIVKEAFILDQECSAADTELEPEAISKLMTDIIRSGKDPGKLKFWWHSHVNMGVFWSGTDDECAETLSTEFAFSLVVNKSKERRARLDLYAPFRITVDHVRLIEISEEDEDLKKKCEEDVKEKVKSKVWRGATNYHGCHGKDWRGHGNGYFGGGHGNYTDPYDLEEDKRPKNWGKRVKLKEEEIDDIKRLKETVHSLAYTDDALEDYVKETMIEVMRKVYEDKANCQEGPGSYWEEETICQKCNIKGICKILSERFGDDLYEGENIVKDIDITEDPSGEIVEVIVDANEGDGENNG